MTDLIDRADSGEIVPLTALMDAYVLEPTRSLTGYARNLPPTQFLRRAEADADETVEMYIPTTIAVISDPLVVIPDPLVVTAEFALLPPGQPRPPAPLPTPPKPERVRPDNYRSRHRRPVPVWARRVVLLGLGSVGTVVVELAGLAALAVLR